MEKIRKTPQEKLINSFSNELLSLLKSLITLSVDLRRFDFNFFRDGSTKINDNLLKIITFNFEDFNEGINKIKELLKTEENNFSEMDKLAIYLFLRFYDAKEYPDYELELLDIISNTNDKEIIKAYTGKKSLSVHDRQKIKNCKNIVEFLELW